MDAEGRVRSVVVVGNGMVGHRLCERVAALDHGRSLRVTAIGAERRAAYDRVALSSLFAGRSANDLALADPAWYAAHGIDLVLGDRVVGIDRARRSVVTASGARHAYDALVLACGSRPFVPPVPGCDTPGVFVYRTIEDLEAIRNWAERARSAAVIGGGLLGLEAAKAARDLGLETHVVEFADRLMPRQVDAEGGRLLRRSVEALGIHVHLRARTERVVGSVAVEGLRLAGAQDLPVDLVIVSAGIRPRDELARAAGLAVHERGGVVVDDALATSDPRIAAIGEVACHRERVHGLVGPGYVMAEVLARRLLGEEARFEAADPSTKLKLLGIDVAHFGDGFADQGGARTRTIALCDEARGVYQKLVVDEAATRVLGGILVGDASRYPLLHAAATRGDALREPPHALLLGASGEAGEGAAGLSADAQVCSCNNVTKREITEAILARDLSTPAEVKACTRAGTGCGGCLPLVSQILATELERTGRAILRHLCEHFPFTREELFWIVKLGRIESFDALLDSHGRGSGCEVCRPAVASILAATWNDLVANHATIQDTNDRFLANIQRGGTYSVIPRVPGGEITPEKLIALGEVARRHDLYCKITGGQRIDLLGARVEQLPEIWEALVAAGFESGHAYGKAMRTVKSCIGSTWCRYGVQDSTAFAIRIEERYRGLRAPHKLKSAVSGCVRECAEAQNKDFGLVATERGWNLYLCGNGGAKPRHGDLFATDLSEDEVVRLLDRFLMFYIQTARPLQRTARWLEELPGGVERLRSIVVDDALGLCAQLEADMQRLVDGYRCEWRAVVEDPALRASFRHFAHGPDPDDSLAFVRERGQRRPADWPAETPAGIADAAAPEGEWRWVRVAREDQVPRDGGIAVRHGALQVALFHFARRGEWYATQNRCPHRKDMVLARGLLGDQAGEAKVACPMHKKTFSLCTGKGLSDPEYALRVFPVRVEAGWVFVKLPPETGAGEALREP